MACSLGYNRDRRVKLSFSTFFILKTFNELVIFFLKMRKLKSFIDKRPLRLKLTLYYIQEIPRDLVPIKTLLQNYIIQKYCHGSSIAPRAYHTHHPLSAHSLQLSLSSYLQHRETYELINSVRANYSILNIQCNTPYNQ